MDTAPAPGHMAGEGGNRKIDRIHSSCPLPVEQPVRPCIYRSSFALPHGLIHCSDRLRCVCRGRIPIPTPSRRDANRRRQRRPNKRSLSCYYYEVGATLTSGPLSCDVASIAVATRERTAHRRTDCYSALQCYSLDSSGRFPNSTRCRRDRYGIADEPHMKQRDV